MSPVTILKRPEVSTSCGLGRTALYEAIRRGEFPAPLKLTRRAVGWRSDQVQAWIESRPSARAGGAK